MEAFSALLAICAGNSPVPGEFPAQMPVTRCFHVFFDLRLNKRLNKQPWGWWFEPISRPLWRHRNELKKSRGQHWESQHSLLPDAIKISFVFYFPTFISSYGGIFANVHVTESLMYLYVEAIKLFNHNDHITQLPHLQSVVSAYNIGESTPIQNSSRFEYITSSSCFCFIGEFLWCILVIGEPDQYMQLNCHV